MSSSGKRKSESEDFMIFSIPFLSTCMGRQLVIDGCRPLKIVKQANIDTFMTVSMVFFWGNPLKNPPVAGWWVAHGHMAWAVAVHLLDECAWAAYVLDLTRIDPEYGSLGQHHQTFKGPKWNYHKIFRFVLSFTRSLVSCEYSSIWTDTSWRTRAAKPRCNRCRCANC